MTEKRKNGYIFFTLLIAAAMILALALSLADKRKPPEQTEPGKKLSYSVGIIGGDGYSVTGENPITVENGSDVIFLVDLEDGFYFSDLCGCTYENGMLTVPSVSSDRTVFLKTASFSDLPSVVCRSGEHGKISISDPREHYFEGEKVQIKIEPDAHYVLSSLTVNGEQSPLPSGNSLTFTISGSLDIEAGFAGEEHVLSYIPGNTFGTIKNNNAKDQYRYGDKIDLVAEFDPASVSFAGWSDGATISGGGKIVCYTPAYTGTLTGDVNVYANFVQLTSFTLSYDANGGNVKTLPGSAEYGENETVSIAIDNGNFSRPGYMFVGFNTKPDGSGDAHGCGTQFVMPPRNTTLYAIFYEYTNQDFFTYTKVTGGVAISGLSEAGKAAKPERIVFAPTHDGKSVVSIAASAFAECSFIKEVYLPRAVKTILSKAFAKCENLKLVCFPETITQLYRDAFSGCTSFSDMRVHATLPTVFDIYYDSALFDKYNRLKATAGRNRIILVGGSSASFGMNSEKLLRAFPEYEPLNFSCSVYYGILPILEMVRANVHEGDIIVLALEYRNTMYGSGEESGYTNWQYLESNYDMLADMDMRKVPGILNSFVEYLSAKRGYVSSGTKLYKNIQYSRSSFNIYGDNVSKRSAGAISGSPISTSVLKSAGISVLNAFCSEMKDRGVQCWYSFPPICRPSGASDASVRNYSSAFLKALDGLIDHSVCDIISDPYDYVFGSKYFWDSIYHMNNAGAELRADQLVKDIRNKFDSMKKEGAQ